MSTARPLRLVIATANRDKEKDIRAILADSLPALQLLDRPAEVGEVEETGETLEENARLKAVALCRATGIGAVADDTGLEVEALGGAPGVYSARYAGEHASYDDNVAKLLAALEGVTERAARFSTVSIVVFPDGTEVVARGTVDGRIATERRGADGFGYDPLFLPDEGDGRSFAEMTHAEKNLLSHRGRAFRRLADLLAAK